MGATLVEIDTVWEKGYNNKVLVQEICPCMYDSITNGPNSFEIAGWDENWSQFIDYKEKNPDSSYFVLFMNDYNLAKVADLRYAENVPYQGTDISILENKVLCWDLISRWYVYSRILFGITLLCCLWAIFIAFCRNQLDRFKLGNDTIQMIIMAAFWLCIIIALLSLLLGLFLEPELDSIGAGNQGESNFWILVKAACIGVILGIIFKTSSIKNKFKRKNQP